MYSLNINGIKYPLDKEWTLKEWMDLHKFDTSQEFLWPRMISQATGAPSELVYQIDHEVLHQAMVVITRNMQPSWVSLSPTYKGQKFIDLNKLTIGQFIDLEVALSRGLESNLHWLVGTLYSTEGESCLEWNYEVGFAAVQTWYVRRKQIYSEYEDLFDMEDGDGTPSNEDPGHAWYDMLMVLADGEFLNIQHVVDRPMIEALNFLAWKKDQARKLELEQKKLQMTRR